MTYDELRTLTKQALGNRNVTSDPDAWYGARVNTAYRRLCTFQGHVKRGGMRQPQFRQLRFFELMDDVDNTITSALTDNFVTPATDQASLFGITDVYDVTHARRLTRPAKRYMHHLNPDATGIPTHWVPDGSGGIGYRIYPRPGSSTDNITVREYVYLYPDALVDADDEPVIPPIWHSPIWMAAAAEGAKLLDMPDKAVEMEAMFTDFIAEQRTPVDEATHSGGRRYMTIGTRY